MPIVVPVNPTPLPTPPSTSDPVNFDPRADAFLGGLPNFQTQTNALAEATYQNALESQTQANNASDSALAASQSAAGAQAVASYKGEWSSLSGTLNPPATVSHQGRLWYLKQALANVASQPPSLGSAYWGEVGTNEFIIYPAPAGNTTAIDRGFYRLTSASSVLVLPAAPFDGMIVAAVNLSGALTPYISRNGKTICGDAENYLMNILGFQIVLQYNAASNDWMRINGFTAFTPFSTNQPFNQVGTWTAAQNFGAGASFGDGKVLLRKTITFTAPAFNASSTSIATAAHNLTYSKIRDSSVLVVGASFASGPEYGAGNNIKYSAYIDSANCNIVFNANQGQDVAGRPVYFTIYYEA